MEQVGDSGSFCWASDFYQPLAKIQIFRTLGPVSRTSRKPLGLEKPFVKLRPPYSVKLVFSYVVKGWKIEITVSCLESPSFWRYNEINLFIARLPVGRASHRCSRGHRSRVRIPLKP